MDEVTAQGTINYEENRVQRRKKRRVSKKGKKKIEKVKVQEKLESKRSSKTWVRQKKLKIGRKKKIGDRIKGEYIESITCKWAKLSSYP